MNDMEFYKELVLESLESAKLSPHECEQAFNIGIIALQDADISNELKREVVLDALDTYVKALI